MAVDPASVLALRPGILDYQQLQQAFQAKQAADQQALQTGAIAQQSQGNILGTQILAAASAPAGTDAQGNPVFDPNAQARYRNALQTLSSIPGFNANAFAPDVQTGYKQVQAAKLAQSPLGSLLNVATKEDANNIAAGTAAGKTVDPNAVTNAVLSRGAAGIMGAQPSTQPAAAPVSSAAQSSTPSQADALAATTNATPSNPGMSLGGTQSTAGSALPTDTIALPSRTDPKYNNPKLTQAANQANFAADLEAAQAQPAYKAAVSGATAAGTEQGNAAADAKTALNVMMNNIPSVVSRTNGIIQNAPNASSGMGVDAEGHGIAPQFDNTALGQYLAPGSSGANAQMQKLAAQGAFPEIAAALKNSNIKGNKFLETLMNNGLSINMQSPSNDKINQAQTNLGNYIQQVKSVAGQLRAMGQQAPADSDIDTMFTGAGAVLPQVANTPQTAAVQAALPAAQTPPAAAAIPEGATATNAMGHKIVFKGGQWQPM